VYFVAEQTEWRSGFEAPFAPDFTSGAYHVVRGVAMKLISRQVLKRDQ
jgi:hypothetical protein